MRKLSLVAFLVLVHCRDRPDTTPVGHLDIHDPLFAVYVGVTVALILFGGLMSGLTLGLLSLDDQELRILSSVGEEREKKRARRIASVVKHRHWLLVTLLLCNAAAMEALPLVLNKIAESEVISIVVAVTAVLFFGEIIPQAICRKYGLAVGSVFAYPVKFLMFATAVLSYPIAKLLDAILGVDHNEFYRRAFLKELVSMHAADAHGGPLTTDEVTVIKSALDLRDKTVEQIMTPLEKTFMLDATSAYDHTLRQKIFADGHSRIPVFSGSPQNVIGALLVKNLLGFHASEGAPLTHLPIRKVPYVPSAMGVYEALNLMQTGRSHLAMVYRPVSAQAAAAEERGGVFHSDGVEQHAALVDGVVGIVTLEDIIEELIGEEIVDESDKYIDVSKGRLATERSLKALFGANMLTSRNLFLSRQIASERNLSTREPLLRAAAPPS